jgi:hypothetical protein
MSICSRNGLAWLYHDVNGKKNKTGWSLCQTTKSVNLFHSSQEPPDDRGSQSMRKIIFYWRNWFQGGKNQSQFTSGQTPASPLCHYVGTCFKLLFVITNNMKSVWCQSKRCLFFLLRLKQWWIWHGTAEPYTLRWRLSASYRNELRFDTLCNRHPLSHRVCKSSLSSLLTILIA